MKPTSVLFALAMTLPLTGCGGAAKEQISISYGGESSILSFAKSEILASSASCDIEEGDNGYKITFETVDKSLGEQSFRTVVDGKSIHVYGGDENGLLYGGLALSDYIKANGTVEGYAAQAVSPRQEERMLKVNAPLDMRCPSYSDTGANTQEQIKDMWDIDFWKEYFAEAARNRFNAVNLWSLNPFPVLTKVPGYEDCALDDVWKTKIPFDTNYAGNCSNAVQEKHWEEGTYDIIKTITIDEKIAHFNSVIDLAHDHGIKFYISCWNVYTFGEHGKYGITSSLANPTTKDYYGKAVTALLETYPGLDGLGVCTGEYMLTSDVDLGGTEDSTFKEQWLHDTYGESLKAYLAKNPKDFKLIHRMHFTNYADIEKIWGDMPCPMDISTKYSDNHMFVNGDHHFADETLNALPDGKYSLLEIRNSDCYNLRMGDYSFVSNYYANMDKLSHVSGVVFGSDGYVDGREYFYQDDSFNGTLSLKKHFAFYSLFGNLAYDASFSEDLYKGLFAYHFKGIDEAAVGALYDALQQGSKVIPTVSSLYFNDGDATWYAEGNNAHPNSFGYLNVKRWVNANNAHPYANCISISEYCGLIRDGGAIPTDKDNPLTIAAKLKEISASAEEAYKKIAITGEDKTAKEFLSLALDQHCFYLLGEFYAEKILAIVDLRAYNDLGTESKKDDALTHIKASIDAYGKYAESFHKNYKPMWLTWTCDQDLNDLYQLAKEDQSAIENWKKRNY
ncbi:MAG: hypothetical protein K6F32_05515 [Bacilli bacterium]|nr:hypothetical protein [Bacilli bacterium]